MEMSQLGTVDRSSVNTAVIAVSLPTLYTKDCCRRRLEGCRIRMFEISLCVASACRGQRERSNMSHVRTQIRHNHYFRSLYLIVRMLIQDRKSTRLNSSH